LKLRRVLLIQQVRIVAVNGETEIDAALARVLQEKAGGLLVGSDPMLAIVQNRDRFIAFAARHALPAAYDTSDRDEGDGLISYGISIPNAYFQAGIYVGRVLKGEKPSDLPVVRSDKFELTINLKTAKILGLTIPSGVLAIADKVIE
jgi:putative ABC transport system substrate-binding protein